MEVHHHSHHEGSGHRKKWTHYVWEFIMLFLAVFCGFLAENKREHLVEHQREKKYMESMVEDLANDTVELHRALSKADSLIKYTDSAVVWLRDFQPVSAVPADMSEMIGRSGQRQSLIITDRTSSQLKNSGAMRLIRNEEVSTMILKYWNHINETNISLDRYMVYRNAAREITFRLWVIPEIYTLGTAKPVDSLGSVRIIDNNRQHWDELTNLTMMSGVITRTNLVRNFKTLLETARALIALIKDKYHLK